MANCKVIKGNEMLIEESSIVVGNGHNYAYFDKKDGYTLINLIIDEAFSGQYITSILNDVTNYDVFLYRTETEDKTYKVTAVWGRV